MKARSVIFMGIMFQLVVVGVVEIKQASMIYSTAVSNLQDGPCSSFGRLREDFQKEQLSKLKPER